MKTFGLLMIGFWLGFMAFPASMLAYEKRATIAKALVEWWARLTGRAQ